MTTSSAISAVTAIQHIACAIRDLRQVPSGHLYAVLMEFCDLPTFEKVVGIIERAGLIKKQGDLLVWIGPKA